MRQAWPSISLNDKDDDPEAQEPLEAPGKPRANVKPDGPDTPAPEIENTDPNAAENQPEPGQDPVPIPHRA